MVNLGKYTKPKLKLKNKNEPLEPVGGKAMAKKINKRIYEFCKFFEDEFGVTLIDEETGMKIIDYGTDSDNDRA